MKIDRLHRLLNLYTKDELNNVEQDELRRAFADPSNAHVIKEWIAQRWKKENLQDYLLPEQSQSLYDSIWEAIAPKKRIFHRVFLRRIAVAASVLILMVAIRTFFVSNNIDAPKDEPFLLAEQFEKIKAPDVTKATISLANGQIIYVDSIDKGEASKQDGVEIIKLEDGELQIKGNSDIIAFSTLTNPKGSKILTVTLTDGTKVWLNAASKIIFPTKFINRERRVELSGEAYLEVAHNKNIPFIINTTGGVEVRVFGTKLNIKAYYNENEIKTTLVEGSVSVTLKEGARTDRPVFLKPGQQASLDKSGVISVVNANIDESIAWKRDMFYFDDVSLEYIMNSLARWYDVDVIYNNEELKNLTFGVVISRKENISEIAKLLKMTGTVDFDISGRKIFVKN